MDQKVAVENDMGRVWGECLERVRGEVPSPYFTSMISPLRPISLENGVCTVGVPNSFTKDIIESRFMDTLTRAMSEAVGHDTSVILTVSTSPEMVESMAIRTPAADDSRETNSKLADREATAREKKYTFENFVVGDSNKFAYNAALMVAEVPGHNYNPLFIHGATGLGKTHLLRAIEDYAKKLNPNIRVRYVQTSVFIDEFIATVTLKRDKATFDQKYINNKIVLFDDIQALSGTDATQNKFFDVFNLLYGSNSHIVLSSDRPPSQMSRLSDRIQSRFEGGLIIDIKPPDLETRLAILRLKARSECVEIPDDALIYIASKVKDNIRSLEGLFNRVVAYAKLYGMRIDRIDLSTVQDALKDQIAETEKSKTPTVDLIQNLVSNYYNIPRADLIGKSRSRSLVHCRQVAMYLCREHTTETLISIGSKFGNRDHSTVLHSYRKVETMLKQQKEVLQEVGELTNMINKST